MVRNTYGVLVGGVILTIVPLLSIGIDQSTKLRGAVVDDDDPDASACGPLILMLQSPPIGEPNCDNAFDASYPKSISCNAVFRNVVLLVTAYDDIPSYPALCNQTDAWTYK